MKSMGRIFGLAVAALMVCVFALPANAGNDKKQYSLVMSVPPNQAPAPGEPFIVKAKIKNEGNSSIHSFQLFVTGVTIVGFIKPDDVKVTIPVPGTSISFTKMDDLESGESRTFTLKVNSCGDGQWLASVWNGAQLNGQSFSLASDRTKSNLTSSIPCGPPLAAGATFAVPDTLNPACITGMRDYYDKDGTIPGGSLAIFVTNTVPTNGQMHFRWAQDITGDPAAAFDYSVCGSGHLPLTQTTLAAWLNTDGTLSSQPGTPAFVPAQQCVQPTLPAPPLASLLPVPYGTLVSVSAVTADTATLNVDTTQPTGTHGVIAHGNGPFDIVIGTERMRVDTCAFTGDTDHDGPYAGECGEGHEGEPEIWYVTRHVGGTLPTTILGLPIQPNTLVMYTPLPLLPSGPVQCLAADGTTPLPASSCYYVGGNQAQMCVVEQVDSVTGHVTEFIDIGDGYVGHP